MNHTGPIAGRRRLTLKLRTAILAVLVSGGVFGVVAHHVQQQHKIASIVRSLGGRVQYERGTLIPSVTCADLTGCDLNDAKMRLVAQIDVPELRIGANPITDRGLSCLVGLKNLTRLDIHYISVAAGNWRVLSELGPLRALDVSANEVTNDDLRYIGTSMSLESLDLSGTRISDTGLKHLGGLKALRKLDLSQTELDGTGLVGLHDLTLRSLDLNGTKVYGHHLDALARPESIEQLGLSDTLIDDSGLAHVVRFRNLTERCAEN